MNETCYLIVNADDFGQSPEVTAGILEAHDRGVVTSASMMTRWPGAVEAASQARNAPRLSVGLHLDLGEWRLSGDTWVPLYHVVPLDDERRVEREIRSQLAAFRDHVGRNPTHLDSHQHVHLREPVRSIATSLAHELGVPLRRVDSPATYVGDFYGQTEDGGHNGNAISPQGLINLLHRLPSGLQELACHPGRNVKIDTMYRVERDLEVDTLCDPSIRKWMETLGIVLCNFENMRATGRAADRDTP